MDASHFDRVARWFGASPSRRHLLSLMLAGVLGVRGTGDAEARKKRRWKKKKIKRNAFGCVNVGKFCKKASQCCSGVCKGKKGKKKCKAHDTGGCRAGQSNGDCGGVCDTTTGKAGYCGVGAGACFACAKDADCQPFCGPQAACIVCSDACAGTACFGPGACTFPPP